MIAVIIGLCVIASVFGWAMCRAAGFADADMERMKGEREDNEV